MSGPAIPAIAKMADRVWFRDHPTRKLRIRAPVEWEFQTEFRQFGLHEETRRRIIVSRIPAGMAKRHNVDFLRVAFLLFSDETVEDTDEILGPILNQIMKDAAEGYGMTRH